ncbi:MAG: class I SAM-dependent methyltransferase [Chloroflexia bacterium]|nr:class I SAM-dependent methyltransferase [Chloroflexia bacterium]
MNIDFSELNTAAFWDQAFAAANANWRRLPTSERTQTVIRLLLQHEAQTVLDLGCAIGRLSMLIAAQGIDVHGLDASEKAIQFARDWARDEHMPNVHFEVGLTSTLQYPDGMFDAVVANAVLDHMPVVEAKKSVQEIWAVLRPGGLLFASFDGMEEKKESPHHLLEDGTRLYVDGMQRGLVWRYYSEQEIDQLFARFEQRKLYTDQDGSRVLIAVKPAAPDENPSI